MIRAFLATTALAIGLAVALPADARWFGGNDDGPGGHMMHSKMMMGGPGAFCTDIDARIAGLLAFGEKKLDITDAQRPAWNKLAEAIKAGVPAVKKTCDDMKVQHEAKDPAPLPQHFAAMQTMVGSAKEQLDRIQPALTELYNQLTPDQKKIADGMIGPHHGGGEFFGHHFGATSKTQQPASK